MFLFLSSLSFGSFVVSMCPISVSNFSRSRLKKHRFKRMHVRMGLTTDRISARHKLSDW